MMMLEVQNLSVKYGQHQALNSVSISAAENEIVVILGANGAGKSTLLKALSGMVPSSGQISVGGRPIHGQMPHKIVEAGLALVPEGRGIFGELSVQENLILGAYAQRARASEASNLDQVFSLFPRLTERRRQLARTMSGGEQQMVAIGRAMMSAPDILMLDEPSLGLSPLLCRDLFKALEVIRASGTSVLLVEQNARQSLAIANRAYLLENGHIVGEGPAEELAKDPAIQKAYLGGAASSLPVGASESSVASDLLPAHDIQDAIDRRDLRVNPTTASADVSIDTGSIQSLVEHAARTQEEHIVSSRDAAITSGDTDHTSHGTILSNIVARIELAATAARRPDDKRRPKVHIIKPSGRSSQSDASDPTSVIAENPENANTHAAEAHKSSLQVWRRGGVRIYRRRRPDGPLERIDPE